LIWSLEDLGIRFSHMKNDQDGWKATTSPGEWTQILKTSLCGQSLLCLHTCMSVYPDILQKSWRAWKLRVFFRKRLKQTFTKQQGNFFIAMTLMK
jgi:hypothetical protein